MFVCKAAASLGLNLCQPLKDEAFLEHVAEYGLSYGTREEYEFRSEIFYQTDAEY